MRGLGESCCFCTGGSKSARTKASIYSGKGSTMAQISTTGTGFLIHPNLLLTTHAILPSVTSATTATIRLQNGVAASLFPHRFFITNTVLDLTIVGIRIDSKMPSQHPHYLKTGSKPSLNLGSRVYLLGYTDENKVTVGEGKVVIATDNLIKVCTAGVTLSPGSPGFDAHGKLSFMVCDPMKLATSPNTKSTSTLQFGIPIPVISDWLNRHWENGLDDILRVINKPKLPIIRLMFTGKKSEQSCTSFTMGQVFKPTKSVEQPGPSQDETRTHEQPAHVHRILTPEIYESPKLTSIPLKKNKNTRIQLLDVDFLHKITGPNWAGPALEVKKQPNVVTEAETSLTGLVVRSCSSSGQVLEGQNGYISEGETTMYSAETAESRDWLCPIEGQFSEANPVAQGRKVFLQGSDRYSPTVSSLMKKWTNLEQQWQQFIAHKNGRFDAVSR